MRGSDRIWAFVFFDLRAMVHTKRARKGKNHVVSPVAEPTTEPAPDASRIAVQGHLAGCPFNECLISDDAQRFVAGFGRGDARTDLFACVQLGP